MRQEKPVAGRRPEKTSVGRRHENNASTGSRQEKAGGGRSPHADSGRVHAQAAAAVERIVRASETRRGGCAVKGLTLAAGNVAKRATHAVTCETLRYLPVIKDLIAATNLANSAWMKAKPHLVYVLVYDLVVSGKVSHPSLPATLLPSPSPTLCYNIALLLYRPAIISPCYYIALL
ncbi:hypothetical protein CLOP_g13002 [Closterium sp. NIES-67]|nr:hypothetical protein CLOP_g13002 [Closterium sp. NIES-67]